MEYLSCTETVTVSNCMKEDNIIRHKIKFQNTCSTRMTIVSDQHRSLIYILEELKLHIICNFGWTTLITYRCPVLKVTSSFYRDSFSLRYVEWSCRLSFRYVVLKHSSILSRGLFV